MLHNLQVALLDLDTAYSNFFKGRADFPKFKKKSNRGSFNVPQNVIVENDLLIIPKFLRKSIERLKVLQRRASKKQKGSNNKKKANKRVAVLHEKITNQRQDFLHKTSTKLIRENQTIFLENLGVSNMMKNHNLAQAISDVSWPEFNRMIEYKAEWYGVNVLRIGRFTPSSKTCECGSINKELKLSDRVWKCKSCGRVNDRDLLAARNIKKFALYKESSEQELPVEPVELSALAEAMKQEAHPISSAVGG